MAMPVHFRAATAGVMGTALLALSGANAIAGTAAAPSPTMIDEETEDCTELVPEQASIAGITDDGREISLDVHVLLDGVGGWRGREVMSQVQEAYTPLNIKINASYQEVDIPHQRIEPEFIGDEPRPVSDSSYLFEKAKEAVGGQRPPNIDVVYLMTSDGITGTTAGVADCIGGIRYPTRAFAIGEAEEDRPHSSTLNFCCTWATAKIAAHEIGHLLGAHHHYANCAEGAPTAVEDRHLFTCTVMFNDLGGVNLRFSTAEGVVVRGHAVEYAERPFEYPEEPEDPEGSTHHARRVILKLKRHLVARGRVDAGDAEICSAAVEVDIKRRAERGWRTIDRLTTDLSGRFASEIPDRTGTYRAVLDAGSGEDGDRAYNCAQARSKKARHRHD